MKIRRAKSWWWAGALPVTALVLFLGGLSTNQARAEKPGAKPVVPGVDDQVTVRTLKVHPRRDPANPLTGVFATRAPVRPNLIGLTACRILKVTGNVLEVADLDAKDGSPILDLKPYLPRGDSIPEALFPEWVKRSKPPAD